MSYQVYAVAVVATRPMTDEERAEHPGKQSVIATDVMMGVCADEGAARAHGLRHALNVFPARDGWNGHDVSARLIDAELLARITEVAGRGSDQTPAPALQA